MALLQQTLFSMRGPKSISKTGHWEIVHHGHTRGHKHSATSKS